MKAINDLVFFSISKQKLTTCLLFFSLLTLQKLKLSISNVNKGKILTVGSRYVKTSLRIIYILDAVDEERLN